MAVTENKSEEFTTLTLPITGMTCAACQSHVERALRGTSGVEDAKVNLMTHSARVVFNPLVATPGSLAEAVHDAGYEAHIAPPPSAPGTPGSPAHVHEHGNEAESSLRLKAIYALAAAVVAMVLSIPLMSSTGGMHSTFFLMPILMAIPAQTLRLVLLALSLAGMFWAGGTIYRGAWKSALHRSTNMNTLVALGTMSAFLYSVAATFFPGAFLRHGLSPDVYYESVLWILGFLLLGQWLDARTKRRTLAAVESFARLQPQTVRLLQRSAPLDDAGHTSSPGKISSEAFDGAENEVEVPLSSVKTGDIILVRPGERIPVDGEVLSGMSTADESLLTGESTPVQKLPGSRLIGGSLNYDGALKYRATSVGTGSVLGQMLQLLDQAQSSRAPMQQLADRVSSIFVPVVLALAALSFILWTVWGGNASRAFAVAVTVLVIACPCAMGLAIPAALTAAVGRGAQLGILFKGGEAVERLARIDAVAFDKTGTLTLGKPRIVAVRGGQDPNALLRIAASLEQSSEHPLARAVVDYAKQAGLELFSVPGLTNFPGQGITGTVDGKTVAVGNAELFSKLGIPLVEADTKSEQAGTTLLHVAIAGSYRGSLEARDILRPTAVQAVRSLRKSGIKVSMLTGDSSSAASAIAQALEISSVYAGLSPERKVETIRELQSSGLQVAMVGDGVNDAAALAEADAGIAVGTGTDIARDAGDVILLGGDPQMVAIALRLARETRRVMRQNLAWALAYNVLGIPIAAGILFPVFKILLSPSIASAAMAMSSLSVLFNSLRLKAFRA